MESPHIWPRQMHVSKSDFNRYISICFSATSFVPLPRMVEASIVRRSLSIISASTSALGTACCIHPGLGLGSDISLAWHSGVFSIHTDPTWFLWICARRPPLCACLVIRRAFEQPKRSVPREYVAARIASSRRRWPDLWRNPPAEPVTTARITGDRPPPFGWIGTVATIIACLSRLLAGSYTTVCKFVV
jgi:hypothetical protein